MRTPSCGERVTCLLASLSGWPGWSAHSSGLTSRAWLRLSLPLVWNVLFPFSTPLNPANPEGLALNLLPCEAFLPPVEPPVELRCVPRAASKPRPEIHALIPLEERKSGHVRSVWLRPRFGSMGFLVGKLEMRGPYTPGGIVKSQLRPYQA